MTQDLSFFAIFSETINQKCLIFLFWQKEGASFHDMTVEGNRRHQNRWHHLSMILYDRDLNPEIKVYKIQKYGFRKD